MRELSKLVRLGGDDLRRAKALTKFVTMDRYGTKRAIIEPPSPVPSGNIFSSNGPSAYVHPFPSCCGVQILAPLPRVYDLKAAQGVGHFKDYTEEELFRAWTHFGAVNCRGGVALCVLTEPQIKTFGPYLDGAGWTSIIKFTNPIHNTELTMFAGRTN